ncbi:threonine synthase [Dethiosulfovibrio salsuginis]|uniref:Threonine synthase n=1 Tax=Dethiosulfovibrio salsuginis TaxID=561720 RepID=A0A1X7JH53_9BACT|nr:threonine synthase [Dethiosulfovibrio salsuginis]SMG27017.1 L-threonine synthase [Dethiosulfovibrio salsuginis]
MVFFRFTCTSCGKATEEEALRCPLCDEPMDVEADLPSSFPPVKPKETLMERFRDFFPFADPRSDLSLGEGFTPLVDMEALGRSFGLSSLWAKNEGANPTWSFKDRGTLTGVIHAMEMGYDRIGTVSTGNMAASVAAYGARAGIETVVLVNKGLPREKLGPIAMYGPRLIKVDGDYGRLYHESLRIGKKLGIYFINSDAPFRVIGSKTISYEIWEQLNRSVPDWVVVPVSAGGNLRGIVQGFVDLVSMGLLNRLPRFLVVQAEGCSPIVKAFEEGAEKVRRFDSPHTVAHAIENPFPPSGNQVLRLVRANGWSCKAVSEDSIIEAQRALAFNGLFVQPASAVALAGLKKAMADGTVEQGQSAALILTGAGLKYTAVFGQHDLSWTQCSLDKLEKALR